MRSPTARVLLFPLFCIGIVGGLQAAPPPDFFTHYRFSPLREGDYSRNPRSALAAIRACI